MCCFCCCTLCTLCVCVCIRACNATHKHKHACIAKACSRLMPTLHIFPDTVVPPLPTPSLTPAPNSSPSFTPPPTLPPQHMRTCTPSWTAPHDNLMAMCCTAITVVGIHMMRMNQVGIMEAEALGRDSVVGMEVMLGFVRHYRGMWILLWRAPCCCPLPLDKHLLRKHSSNTRM